MNALFRSRVFWIGLGSVYGIQRLAAMHSYLPGYFPRIPLGYQLDDVLSSPPWAYLPTYVKSATIYFTFIAIAYFIPAHGLQLVGDLPDCSRLRHAHAGTGRDRPGRLGRSTLWLVRHLRRCSVVDWTKALVKIVREAPPIAIVAAPGFLGCFSGLFCWAYTC